MHRPKPAPGKRRLLSNPERLKVSVGRQPMAWTVQREPAAGATALGGTRDTSLQKRFAAAVTPSRGAGRWHGSPAGHSSPSPPLGIVPAREEGAFRRAGERAACRPGTGTPRGCARRGAGRKPPGLLHTINFPNHFSPLLLRSF